MIFLYAEYSYEWQFFKIKINLDLNLTWFSAQE